ncbi:MAG: arylsulfatase [Planctomycetota bacterium]|nr:arylsulfatase [Planctomycetota bacterium]
MSSLKSSRSCLSLAVVAFLSAAVTPRAKAQTPLKHPNLVIFVADDLGWNDVGYHGSEIQTPNIDQLTRQGIELDRFYVYPFCSPTRTALLTGRSPLSLGITRPLGGGALLPLDEHLLPQTLKAAGYQTLMSGKWHLGNRNEAALPHKRGFDSFYGHTGGFIDYYTHQRGGGLRRRPGGSQPENTPAPDWQRNGKTLIEEGYSTQLIGKEAVRLLQKRNKNQPTFLYVTFNAPHTPLQAPQEFIDRYSTLENQNRRVFAAMVDAMDEEIGKILKVIDEEKMRENTIVLFMSDNGGVARGGASNEPLAKGKGSVYEGGIRVPAVIRWPGVLPKGQKTDQLITAHDLFPTLATALKVKPRNSKPFYGEDLWQSLVAGKVRPHPDVIIASQAIAIFHKQWKMIQTESVNGGAPYRELYLITADAQEQFNLASSYPDLTEELGSIIDRFPKGSRPANGRGNPGGRKQSRKQSP